MPYVVQVRNRASTGGIGARIGRSLRVWKNPGLTSGAGWWKTKVGGGQKDRGPRVVPGARDCDRASLLSRVLSGRLVSERRAGSPSHRPAARGDHFSARVVANAVRDSRPQHPTRGQPSDQRRARAPTPAWACTRWGLPCLACRQTSGALLPHPFTLACSPRRTPSAVCFLRHFPSPAIAPSRAWTGGWALPTTVSCRARTFLTPEPRTQAPTRGRLATPFAQL